MINALKMDLYRLFRTISFYVIIGIIIFTAGTIIWSLYMTSNPALSEAGAIIPDDIAALLPKDLDGYFNSFFQGNFLVLFTVIFTVIFANTEYKNGYIKNIISVVPNRVVLVFSKLLVFLIAITIMHIVTVISILVGCFAFVKCDVSSNVLGIIKLILYGILMNWALSAMTYMLFMFARKSILPMVSGIVYVLMGSSAYMLINMIIEKAFKVNSFAIEKYTVMGNMLYFVNTASDASTLVRAGIVTAIVFVSSTVVSCILIKKKDL